MSRPEWCPNDIWNSALSVSDDPSTQVSAARAILDERNRHEVRAVARLPYNLTARQRDLALYIRDYGERNGIAPSYEEMCHAMGLASKSGVHRIMQGLIERGVVETIPDRARAVRIAERYCEASHD